MKYFKEKIDFLDKASNFNPKELVDEELKNNRNLKDIISSLANK